MRVMLEFQCPDGHITEHFIRNDTDTVPCYCGKEAQKLVCFPSYIKIGKFRSGIDGDAWAARHEKAARKKSLEEM